jgi:hypothetical protein
MTHEPRPPQIPIRILGVESMRAREKQNRLHLNRQIDKHHRAHNTGYRSHV